ncbi:putative F-box domain-containing protein [Medicago truncatula]|uniref:Putative F-box domain-containing protein n=1 Tax=Medicago truncatula TaxID=3880 RepID=A0A396IUQ6_MEDTR|nr:putative F-box domain-containing protein [Medicago truncatula]
MKAAENCQLPWDLLDISRMIDFDDLFQFGSVCKNWRAFHKIYWRNFMAFQEPLLVQRSRVKNVFSFISLSHQKVYHLKMANNFVIFAYHGSSSGYLIMTGKNDSFILINPFTRRKMVINNSVFKVDYSCGSCHALLAFYRGSEEFVLANIGILSLNSANINFLDLKSTPSVTYADYAYVTYADYAYVRLLNCDEHLLVLNFTSNIMFNLYKIDFSTMTYVKLESLGDIALFHAPKKKYYALNNPSMWGYENNSMYVTDNVIHKLRVYKGDDNKMP